MNLRRKIAVGVLSGIAFVSFAAATASNIYLWRLASRFPDPGRELIYTRLIGTGEELGERFTVYLSFTEYVLTCEEAYFLIAGASLVSLLPLVWWKFPARIHKT